MAMLQHPDSPQLLDDLVHRTPRRHVSPSVLEYRIEMLKLELANERRAHRCTKFRLKEAENTILGYKVAEVRCQCGHRYVAHYYEPGPHIACTECDSTKCCADPKSGCDAEAGR